MSPPLTSTVRRWQGEAVQTAAAALRRDAATARGMHDDLTAVVRATASRSWRGGAASAAGRDLAATAGRLLALITAVDLATETTARAGGALVAARAELRRADALAAAAGVAVDESGHVREPPPSLTPRTSVAPWRGAAQDSRDQAQALARSALQAAAAADSLAARSLRGLAGNLVLARLLAASVQVSVPRQLDDDPLAAAAWWMSLTPGQRDVLVRTEPEVLGRLHGLPADVRDSCNRRVLAESHAAAIAALATLERRETGRQGAPLRRSDLARRAGARTQLQRLLANLAAVTAALGPPGTEPPRRLLVLDASGARCAIAVGSPDTATDVAVLVPGFGTTVRRSLASLVRDAAGVLGSAERGRRDVGSSGSTAVIAWLGYAAPAGADVAGTARARAGAVSLRRTLRGLDAAAATSQPAAPVAPRLHLTVVGHSYGSVVTGLAATEVTGADDIVVFGSPGTGVWNAGQLQVAPGHVFVAEAQGDVVARLGRFGTDPGGQAFDGRRLQTDGGPDLTGAPTAASHGHSDYYTDGTESLRNLGWVVAGLPDQATMLPRAR